jgi:hypothetical protein
MTAVKGSATLVTLDPRRETELPPNRRRKLG